MDPIEKAIRNGLSKGDASDPGFRETVYRSVFAALDRALQASPDATVEQAIARRRSLQNKIREIEAGFLAPHEPELSEEDWTPEVSIDRDGREFDGAPSVSIGERRSGSSLDLADGARPGAAAAAPDPDAQRARRPRRFLAPLAALALVLAVFGIGGWLLMGQGLLPAGRPDGTPPRTVEDELAGDESGAGGPLSATTDARDWIRIFSPDDPSTVTVPEGGQASVETAEGIPFLRVRSGENGEPVRFSVGQGVLEQLAGRKAVFDILARAENDADTQVSVECDFGGFGTCGRRRYDVSATTRGDFLFDVEFPDGQPSAGGAIAIGSDVTSGGKAVDIYEIRVSPGG